MSQVLIAVIQAHGTQPVGLEFVKNNWFEAERRQVLSNHWPATDKTVSREEDLR